MIGTNQPKVPVEPVPDGSSLLALPFIAAIAGIFQSESNLPYRLTLHRTMTRGRLKYLQQVTPYAEASAAVTTGSGRIFPVDLKLVGSAFKTGKIWRTKRYDSPKRFEEALSANMKTTGDTRPLDSMPRSWLAVPFIVPKRSPALVLFADSQEFNFFADDARVKRVVGACVGFARLLDALEAQPVSAMRNYPLGSGSNTRANDKAYTTIHEALTDPRAPRLTHLESFNFETVGS